MIKSKYITLVFIALICNTATLSAANRHNLLFWTGGGYSSLSSDSNVPSSGRVGYEVGAGYELRFRNFIMHTGFELQGINSAFVPDDFIHTRYPLVDTQGDLFTGIFYFAKISDYNSLGYVNIPLMFGFSSKKIYFLAGAKVGVNLFGKSTVKSLVKSVGDYDEISIDHLEDIPHHSFFTREEKNVYPIKMKLNYTASFEVGMNMKPWSKKLSSRLGLFCDYGLANIHSNSYSDDLIWNKGSDLPYLPTLGSTIRSSDFRNNTLNSLFVGVKFTLLFGLEGKRDCRCAWE